MARTERTKPPLKEQIQTRANKKPEQKKEVFNRSQYVSTGCTLLNLALTDHPKCGWKKGTMSNIIGDSGTGKTILALTGFAEVTINPKFDDYRLIYDPSERGCGFNISKFFGEKTNKRLEYPEYDSAGKPRPSRLIEDFHANIRAALKKDDPFFYFLDSMDGLDAEDDQKKIDEAHAHRLKRIKAEEEGKELKPIAGSYGMGKAKKNSQILRDICGTLEDTNSFLNIISQTRDNIDPMSFSKKTRSGGNALEFYSWFEMWLAVAKSITTKNIVIGSITRIRISKNRTTGKERIIEVSMYDEFGVDNVGSNIDYLVKMDHWHLPKGAQTIDTKGDLGLPSATKDKLIRMIEDDNLEEQLEDLVGRVWNDFEESLKKNRKKRYE